MTDMDPKPEMSGMDRLTEAELLERAAWPTALAEARRAREILAHRRASQATPAPSDGLREAVERVQRWYPDCAQNQAFMYEADYDGQSKAEWVKLSDVIAALTPAPAQEDSKHDG